MNESVLILTMFAAIGFGTPLIFATVGEIITGPLARSSPSVQAS
jgi:hypothetical protein